MRLREAGECVSRFACHIQQIATLQPEGWEFSAYDRLSKRWLTRMRARIEPDAHEKAEVWVFASHLIATPIPLNWKPYD